MPSTTSGRKRSTMRSADRIARGRRTGTRKFFHGASRSRPGTRTDPRPKLQPGGGGYSGRGRGRERHAETIRRAERGSVAAEAEDQEAEHHERRSHQARLLADDREDEVGVRLGQPTVLLDRVADAHSEHAS